ncbi:DoxX family protein [Actinomadura rupiterrae]|uniref:DoxX family protein n=1 Tax=Actinomadura rupiterrae TaxID=559627 RepID=UPI0020A55363|nr:DoxX family protein [Actinomadura rupiterrae]MCP2342791.1 putative membrane protein YphA (DoxX/SURF4 family) [Actinomadura rupiterrae]
MFIAYIVAAVLLSLLLAGSGRAKLVRDPKITTGLSAVGVPESWFPRLAVLEILGAVGLLAGIAYRPLGIAAGVGVALYFLGAVVTHLRARDTKGAPVPAVILLVAIAPIALGLTTL